MRYWCERAWLPSGVRPNVLVETEDGRITRVSEADRAPAAVRLRGLVLPGFANAHSHAFHRALRGRTHSGGGTFWTWRTRMYELAARLDPDSYRKLATAAYAEMALAGVTCVGEFHYLHHAPGGARYQDPNAMGHALIQAAEDAGIRITLLDTLYLRGGLGPDGHRALDGPQARFGDGDVDGWWSRVEGLRPPAHARVGYAVHSVRAVPADCLGEVAERTTTGPVHVHLSEQPQENADCRAHYGRSPAELLDEHGLLHDRLTAVHATHLSESDIALLGGRGAAACFCPSTEADLADGIGPARELADAGSPISLGTDQHATVDPLLEARALEHGERLRTGLRGRFSPVELITMLTETGHNGLGWPEAGRIEPGAPGDLVAVRLDSPRTAGCLPEQAVLAATASDVDTVVAGGRIVVRQGRHERLGDVGRLLAEVIDELWEQC
jgi:formiminoglutamate deiminase